MRVIIKFDLLQDAFYGVVICIQWQEQRMTGSSFGAARYWQYCQMGSHSQILWHLDRFVLYPILYIFNRTLSYIMSQLTIVLPARTNATTPQCTLGTHGVGPGCLGQIHYCRSNRVCSCSVGTRGQRLRHAWTIGEIMACRESVLYPPARNLRSTT
jgi:hypothetical protein